MKIDEILKSKKEELDVESPPIGVWENIRNDWKVKPKSYSINAWKIAASVLLVTSFSLLFYSQTLKQEIGQLSTLGDISPQYQTMEVQFQSEIDVLESSIPLTELSDSEDYSWLLEELETLDKINKVYRSDIGKIGNEEQLVKVLVDHYEKKIKLLKKLELEISRSKKADELKTRIEQNT